MSPESSQDTPPEHTADDFRPRPSDHLVEPMFVGLGVEGEDEVPSAEDPPRGLLERLWRALIGRAR